MKIRTKKVILFALWSIIVFPVFEVLLSGLSASSTIINLASILAIVGLVLISINTKCFTNFIKTKTNE
jgi:hypothetical protein